MVAQTRTKNLAAMQRVAMTAPPNGGSKMCDHTAAHVVDSEGGITEGKFVEQYECPCGATGTIRGRAEEPAEHWSRTGEIFR